MLRYHGAWKQAAVVRCSVGRHADPCIYRWRQYICSNVDIHVSVRMSALVSLLPSILGGNNGPSRPNATRMKYVICIMILKTQLNCTISFEWEKILKCPQYIPMCASSLPLDAVSQ